MVLLLSGLSIGLMMPFMDSSNGYVTSRYPGVNAGVITALPDAISAFFTPFLGIIIDKIPKYRT